jgi:RNase H-fold protein (predicted Holliday junction resolvase)
MSRHRIIPIKTFVHEVTSKPFIRLGSLDFGMKNIGVAVSDETRITVTPYGSMLLRQPFRSIDSLVHLQSQLYEFRRAEGIDYFVAGFPLTLDDKNLSPLCNKIMWILQNLPIKEGNDPPLTFCLWDETFSTARARQSIKSTSMKRRVMMKHKDAVAAAHILRNFLDCWIDVP